MFLLVVGRGEGSLGGGVLAGQRSSSFIMSCGTLFQVLYCTKSWAVDATRRMRQRSGRPRPWRNPPPPPPTRRWRRHRRRRHRERPGSRPGSGRGPGRRRRCTRRHPSCRRARTCSRGSMLKCAAAAAATSSRLGCSSYSDHPSQRSPAHLHTSPGNRGRALSRRSLPVVDAASEGHVVGRTRVVDLHRRSMGAACAARPGGVPLDAMIHGRRRAHAGRRSRGSASARRAPSRCWRRAPSRPSGL